MERCDHVKHGRFLRRKRIEHLSPQRTEPGALEDGVERIRGVAHESLYRRCITFV